MTSEKIRKEIQKVPEWNATLVGFENCIFEVDFYHSCNSYFSIYKKGDAMCYNNMLTTLTFTKIESLVAFMQGVLYLNNHPVKKER